MHHRSIVILLLAFFVGVSVTLSACDTAPTVADLDEPLLKDFARDTLQLQTSDGQTREFVVYIAKSDEEMKQGLMFIEDLPNKTGMLFRYPRRRIGSMWMKNTLLPLDIFFIKSNGEISDIHTDATPKSLKGLRSSGQVRGALELEAGSAAKYNIRVGDKVLHEHFKTR